ncbi:MAG: DUF1127 domain-containing protein [Tabrizicola sp.]|nr:DUF1127 domain-containing protein [Tabrizicola sp.]
MSRSETRDLSYHPRRGLFARIVSLVGAAAHRRRDRARLSRLDPRLLRDIGLTDEVATTECEKPFWRA